MINYHSFGHEAHCASPYERSRSERFALCANPMPEDFEPHYFEKSEGDTLLIVTGLQGKNLFARLDISLLTKLAQVIRWAPRCYNLNFRVGMSALHGI
jgi:hypothetical protein